MNDDVANQIIAKLNDLQRQINAIARLDVVPTATVTTYSGTPTANALAYWTGAGTVAGGSIAYSNAGTPVLKATSIAGWRLEDDGTNIGLTIADGGVTTVANTLIVTPLASTVRSANMTGLYQYALVPGSITNTQTWTITITLANAGSNFSAAVDVAAMCSSSANPHATIRAMYRASTAFFRNASGATATVATTATHVNSNVGVTVTGPTGVTDGITITFAPSVATVNRNVAYLIITSQIEPTVTSVVA